jgi:hypothetical protein
MLDRFPPNLIFLIGILRPVRWTTAHPLARTRTRQTPRAKPRKRKKQGDLT